MPRAVVQGCMPRRFAVLMLVAGCGTSAPPPATRPAPPAPAASVARNAPQEQTDQIGEAPPEPALGLEGVAEPDPTPSQAIEPEDADVAAALADAEAGQLPAALRRLKKVVAHIDREASLQDRMLAHALMGRAYAAALKRKKAAAEYRAVIELWVRRDEAAKQTAARAAVGQALTAVGEALVYEADEKRRAADALKPPRYTGGDVIRYTKDKIPPWLRKKRVLLDEANAAYRKILDLRPAPPPRWVVASAAHVGAMLESFVADFDAMPVPPALRRDPELRAQYKQVLSDMLEPYRHQAIAAYQMCQSFGQRFHVEDENTRHCAARLKVLDSAP